MIVASSLQLWRKAGNPQRLVALIARPSMIWLGTLAREPDRFVYFSLQLASMLVSTQRLVARITAILFVQIPSTHY